MYDAYPDFLINFDWGRGDVRHTKKITVAIFVVKINEISKQSASFNS